MDITKLQSATAGEQVMINMKTYTIKNDIELFSENQDDIYWQITMKNNIKFIVDNNNISKIINILYKDYDEFTAKWYLLSNRVACIISGTKKTLYLDEYLIPKTNKLLHTHKDNDKLNYRINNIELVSQSTINSKRNNITTTNNQDNQDNQDNDIVELIADNNDQIKFIIDRKFLNKVLQYKWQYNSTIGYIYNYISNDTSNDTSSNTNKSKDSREMLYLHSFIYFTNNQNIQKIEGYSIHHKNINKLDNRIENLELWNTSQPSGQRITDKLQYANEIINTYAEPVDIITFYFQAPLRGIQ